MNKKATWSIYLGVLFSDLGISKGYFHRITGVRASFFFRFLKKILKPAMGFQKWYVLNLLVFFYLWQTFDRQKDLLSRVLRSPWLLHWPITSSWTSPKQNLSQIASKILVFFLFYKNLLIYNLKFFIFMKYGDFSGPYFLAFGLNTDQKKLRIWTLFHTVKHIGTNETGR